jgi:hypothetical protein
MRARLGTVLYWTASAIAVLILALGLWAHANEQANNRVVLVVVATILAALVWLAGRAVRHVLSRHRTNT